MTPRARGLNKNKNGRRMSNSAQLQVAGNQVVKSQRSKRADGANHVLVIGGGPALDDFLRHLDAHSGDWLLARCSDPAECEDKLAAHNGASWADAVIIGPDHSLPFASARRIHELDPSLNILFLAPGRRAGQYSQMLVYSPHAGSIVMRDEDSPTETLAQTLRETVRGTQRNRTHEFDWPSNAERRKTDADLKRLINSERYLASLLAHAPEAIFSTDLEGIVLSWNEAATRLFGFSADVAIGQPLAALFPGDQLTVIEALWRRALEGEPHVEQEISLLDERGVVLEMELVLTLMRDARSEPSGILMIARDITERKQAEQRIAFLAQYDALTSIPNRHLFQDRLSQAMLRAERDEHLIALMSIDLDRFKQINDTFGHTIGDRVLLETAQRIRQAVGEHDSVSRVGGDEFTVLVESACPVEKVEQLAKNVVAAFAKPLVVDSEEIFVAASVGIVLYPFNDDNDMTSLLRCADTAAARAKAAGGNQYQFFTALQGVQADRRVHLESSLRRALERGECLLHYQPQLELGSGRIIGAEALLRWESPQWGLVLPAQFINVAEETGLIVELGKWVLREACRQNREWQLAGLPPIRVAVNLSARQFQDPSLTNSVSEILRESGLDPNSLELEITESLLIENTLASSAALTELKKMGIQIAIDDFGTGYSSLNYLKHFPLNVLKMDASFIRSINSNKNDAAIASAVIALGKSLGLKVVAEGVETKAQLAFLQARRCDAIQGNYFSAALPPNELRALLEARHPAPGDTVN